MEVFKAEEHAGHEELRLLFAEFAMLCKVIPQITTLHDIYNEVKVLSILEGIVHIYKEAIKGYLYLRIKISGNLLLIFKKFS